MATTKDESRMLFERLLDDKDCFFKKRLEKAYNMVAMWKRATLCALDSFQSDLDQAPQVSDDVMSIEHHLITIEIEQLQKKTAIFDKVLNKIQRFLENPHPQKIAAALKESSLNVLNQADVDNLLMKTQRYWSVYGKKMYNTSKTLANDYIQLFREMLSMFEKVPSLSMHDEDHGVAAANYIQENMETFQGLLYRATPTPIAAAEDHTSRRCVHRREANTAEQSPMMDERTTRASNTVQSCSMHEQYEKTCPQSVSFPQYTPDGTTQLGPVGQTPNGLAHKQITGIVDLFCVETRPGEAQARESRIMDTMDQWNAEDNALRRRGLSIMIPTPHPIPRRSPWIPDEELQARRFTKCCKIGVEERADGGYPDRHSKKNSTCSSDQDDTDHTHEGDYKYKDHKLNKNKKSKKKLSDVQAKGDASEESNDVDKIKKKNQKHKKHKLKDWPQGEKEQECDSRSGNLQTPQQDGSSDEIEGKKKKKKSAVKLMKGFINGPVSSAKSVMDKMTTAIEHHMDKSKQFTDYDSDGVSDQCISSTKDTSQESNDADMKKKKKSKKAKLKDQIRREEEQEYGSGSGNLHTFHVAYPENFSDDVEGEKKKKKSAVKLMKGFINSPVNSAKSVMDKVTTVIEHHKDRQYKEYESDSDRYASTKDSLYQNDLDESDEEYGDLDIGQDHYVNVSNISDVMVLAIRDRPARNKYEMSLRKGMVIKQKRCQNEQKMSFGWKRAKHGQKKYGYYQADDVVLYPSKENYEKMDLPFNMKTQNGRC